MATNLKPLAFDAPLARYEQQAAQLHDGYRRMDRDAIAIIKQYHSRYRDPEIRWLARDVDDKAVIDANLQLDDCRDCVAQAYDFESWHALQEYANAMADCDSEWRRFEAAAEAVITGDGSLLASTLRAHPELVRSRSDRRTTFDPPQHRATLLHYIAANGVEGYRQKSPSNAVAIARILLDADSEPDALADMYGGKCTTMSMLVSSTPPAEAGVQVPLVHTLIDYGAAVEPVGAGRWTSPLITALVFGFKEAAEALVARGAHIRDIAAAAGLGKAALVREMLASSDSESRHRALALAAHSGHAEVVRILLDAGEDPDRYNPEGFHGHATPLHHAALSGHTAVVELLIRSGARLDLKDRIYDSTPLRWALYGGKTQIAELLRSAAG